MATIKTLGAYFCRAALVLIVAISATAQTYTDLFNFSSNGGPNGPHFNVIAQGRDGSMYTTSEQGFTGTTRVAFHGKPAQFKVVSDTFLTATVPEHATAGFVTVTTPRGTLTSNKKFQVISQKDNFRQRGEDGDQDHDGRHGDDRGHMSLCEERDHK
jgi:hypothetical protein